MFRNFLRVFSFGKVCFLFFSLFFSFEKKAVVFVGKRDSFFMKGLKCTLSPICSHIFFEFSKGRSRRLLAVRVERFLIKNFINLFLNCSFFIFCCYFFEGRNMFFFSFLSFLFCIYDEFYFLVKRRIRFLRRLKKKAWERRKKRKKMGKKVHKRGGFFLMRDWFFIVGFIGFFAHVVFYFGYRFGKNLFLLDNGELEEVGLKGCGCGDSSVVCDIDMNVGVEDKKKSSSLLAVSKNLVKLSLDSLVPKDRRFESFEIEG